MRNSREIAFLKGATGFCRWGLHLLLLLLAVMILPGQTVSAQTVLTDVWKDKDHRIAVKKIAVFWISQVPQNRLLAENEFVRQLKERGLLATPVYIVIPPDKHVEREAALAKPIGERPRRRSPHLARKAGHRCPVIMPMCTMRPPGMSRMPHIWKRTCST
jgi:hypothetical protein